MNEIKVLSLLIVNVKSSVFSIEYFDNNKKIISLDINFQVSCFISIFLIRILQNFLVCTNPDVVKQKGTYSKNFISIYIGKNQEFNEITQCTVA